VSRKRGLSVDPGPIDADGLRIPSRSVEEDDVRRATEDLLLQSTRVVHAYSLSDFRDGMRKTPDDPAEESGSTISTS